MTSIKNQRAGRLDVQAVVRANFSSAGARHQPGQQHGSRDRQPGLETAEGEQPDLGIERVLGNDGAMSAYGFYKDIKNFTYTTNLAGTGQWTGYTTATSYANGDAAKVKGIELAYMQPLRMLPAPFNRFLVGVNGTLSTSSAQIGRFDKASKQQMNRDIRSPGQSNQVMNLMLGYETAGERPPGAQLQVAIPAGNGQRHPRPKPGSHRRRPEAA